MVDSRPTASVTGRQDWEWNRSQANPQAATTAPRSPTPERSPTERPEWSRRTEVAHPTEVRVLATELERTQQRLEVVVDRYERLLEERNRRLEAEREAALRTRSPLRAIVQALRRFVAGR